MTNNEYLNFLRRLLLLGVQSCAYSCIKQPTSQIRKPPLVGLTTIHRFRIPEHNFTKVQPYTIVVLHNGAPVEMPWINKVKAVVEVYIGGQAVGGATINVLYGNTNPSGRLAETFPLRVQDTPCYLTYGGEHDRSVYSEGVFVGYRYYTSKDTMITGLLIQSITFICVTK